MELERKLCRIFFLCLLAARRSGAEVTQDDTAAESDTSYFFYQDQSYPRDCGDIQDQCSTKNVTGAQVIQPNGYDAPFWVSCSGDWTVIQRRSDGLIDFSRSWDEYRDGFGFINGNHWLGNEKVAHLTNQKTYELRIDFETESGLTGFISYGNFRIIDEFSNYSLVSLGRGNPVPDVPWCPANMIPGECNRCIATCADPSGTVDCSNDCDDIHQTCICPPNYLMDGTDCIRQEECGCYKEGHGVIVDGASYMAADCSEQCTCTSGVLTCVGQSCDQDATCKEVNGVRTCSCNEGYQGDGLTCTSIVRINRDCYDIMRYVSTESGEYSITPSGGTGGPFNVNCNMTIDGGGWTVIQRRVLIPSRQDFNQDWETYKSGFSSYSRGFWIGNEKIHQLTNQGDYELRIDMVNDDHSAYYAKYDLFRINAESDKYKMSGLGSFTGTAGFNALSYHHNAYFSTPDRDYDDYSYYHYADDYDSGWWYGYYYYCDLNWMRYDDDVGYWYNLPGSYYLIYTEMKIRPRQTN